MRVYSVLFFSFLLCLLFSCSQNDGYIGPIFGKWQLQEIDYSDRTEAYDSIFYNFQSGIVSLQRILPYHNTDDAFGFFIHKNDSLTLDIRDRSIELVQQYMLPDTLIQFHVRELTQRKMILIWKERTYLFQKF